jgi:glycosyltransferase involved in cell wall biosynthesis
MIHEINGRLADMARVSTHGSESTPLFMPGQKQSSSMSSVGASSSSRVVHLVGRLSDAPVFRFLLPATDAIAQTGAEQFVVVMDEPRSHHLRAQFDPRLRWVSVPEASSLIGRWKSTQAVFRQLLAEHPPAAVHLHGLFQWLLGAGIAQQASPKVRLVYSPHGSPLMGWSRTMNVVLLWVARRLQGRSADHTIVNLDAETQSLSAFAGGDVEAIESPVDRVFLETPLSPARRPLVVTSSRLDRPGSAFSFAQTAVLLGDESLGLSFNWIGAATTEAIAALKAANVGVFDVKSDADRAQRLSSGWVYFSAGDSPGFPLALVEAMALGMPCVALETPYTRAVLRHEDTGLLCKDSSEIRQAIASLIDSSELRQRLGAAAKRDAQERFAEGRFRDSVLSTYALSKH